VLRDESEVYASAKQGPGLSRHRGFLGTHEPLRGQLRIAQNNADSKAASSSCSSISRPTRAARAFDSYQIALAVFESDLA
jgi:hypothetical protein